VKTRKLKQTADFDKLYRQIKREVSDMSSISSAGLLDYLWIGNSGCPKGGKNSKVSDEQQQRAYNRMLKEYADIAKKQQIVNESAERKVRESETKQTRQAGGQNAVSSEDIPTKTWSGLLYERVAKVIEQVTGTTGSLGGSAPDENSRKFDLTERAAQMAAPIKLDKKVADLEGDIMLALLGLKGGYSMIAGMNLMKLMGKYDPEKMTLEEYEKFRNEMNSMIEQIEKAEF